MIENHDFSKPEPRNEHITLNQLIEALSKKPESF